MKLIDVLKYLGLEEDPPRHDSVTLSEGRPENVVNMRAFSTDKDPAGNSYIYAVSMVLPLDATYEQIKECIIEAAEEWRECYKGAAILPSALQNQNSIVKAMTKAKKNLAQK